MTRDLTARQQEVLDFIRQHHRATDSMPTHKDIARHFGWASATAASDVIAALVKRGALRHVPDASRGIRFAEGESPWEQVDRLRARVAQLEAAC